MSALFSFGKLLAHQFPTESDYAFLNPILSTMEAILVPIMILVATAGMIYAVVLGVNLARADSTDKREEAKKRLINAIVGLVVIVALILVLQLIVRYLPVWIGDETTPSPVISYVQALFIR